MTTNKAAALAKFLERKLKEPDGLSSINPDVLELAVKNAQDSVLASIFFFVFLSFLVPFSFYFVIGNFLLIRKWICVYIVGVCI